jgi:4-amino-4-deoxy-L-arabinose transferase-like glycosyltransferase
MLLVFLAALALRVTMAIWLPEQVIWPDGHRYERVALNLLEGQGFGDLIENHRSVPTQPLLIAAVYSVFGVKNYLALRLVMATIGALSCVVGYLLARSLFGATAGVFAGLLLVAYPHLVYVSALFEYPQTLGILLIATFLLLQLRFAENRKASTLFIASMLLGLAILTQPTLLLFAPVFVLLCLRRDGDWRRNLGFVVTAFAGLTITVGLWTLRNYAEYDRLIVVNAASGTNFWAANNETYVRWGKADSVLTCTGPHGVTSYCLENRAIQADLARRNLTPTERLVERERASWEHGLRFVRESPGRFARLMLTKFIRLWSPWPDALHTGPARGGSMRNAISAATYIPLLALACVGLFLSARECARRLVPIYLFMAVFIAPFTLFLPTMRYRLPIDFLLAIFAAVPLTRLWHLAAKRRIAGRNHAERWSQAA